MRRPIIPYDPYLTEFARDLRNKSTKAERLLWRALKGKKVRGCDFDRQKPIGHYIVDFYCKDLKLAIEIDGDSHTGKEKKDAERQKELEQKGVHFLRFLDADVKNNVPLVVRAIETWIDHQKPTPSPSGGGE